MVITRYHLLFSLLLLALAPSSPILANAETPPVLDPLKAAIDAPPAHPRLLAKTDDFERLRTQVIADPYSRRVFEELKKRAEKILTEPPVTRELTGRRLLDVSRRFIDRVSSLAMLARITHDPRYANRAIAEMRAVAAFSDWNPSHFLDTAEMTFGMALAYDWLFDQLSVADRELFATALLRLGLKPSLDKPQHWIEGSNNWNQVCHGGMVAGAIAIADREPAVASQIIARAITHLPKAARAYAPDGAYAEGPTYWAYGTTYHVIISAALERFTGSTFQTDAYPGFRESADYVTQMRGPSGLYFNYGDGSARLDPQLALFWFASKYGKSEWLRDLIAPANGQETLALDPDRMLALGLLWHSPGLVATPPPKPPTSWGGRSAVPVAVFRSSWDDPNATFVAMKGGSASYSHAHMDVGSFVLESDGVRWAVDTGMQNYQSLEGAGINLWAMGQEGQRWTVFRLGAESHNILRFDNAPPRVGGRGSLSRFSAGTASATFNLDEVYQGQAASVRRGVRLLPDRTVLFQDEWRSGNQPVTVSWQLLTEAETVTTGAGEVTLRQRGRSLLLRVLEPDNVTLAVSDLSAPRAAFDVPNPALKRITLTLTTPAKSDGRLRILAQPGSVPTALPPTSEPHEVWPNK